jgi:pyrroloquinoline quinone biosynthesis protein D
MPADYMHTCSPAGADAGRSGEETMVDSGASRRRTVSLSDVPRVHGETALQKVGGRWVAATPDDQLHSFELADGEVSEVGERVVELIDGKRSVADIVEALLKEFEVSREVAESDTLDFIGLLADKRVLTL